MESVKTKTILAKTSYGDKWFGIDYNMNLYRGCNHGCIYCDSRSNCYHIDDFDTVHIKEKAIDIFQTELSKKRIKGVIGIGAMSDTYNPFEQKYELTRKALSLILDYGFGVSIDTKSNLILRDTSLLSEISKKAPVIIKFTITTVDDKLSEVIEPHVIPSSKRFRAIKELSDAGVYVGILFTPILPFLTDYEGNVRQMVKLAHLNKAHFIYFGYGMTLRENQRDYYYQQLEKSFPGLKEKYIKKYGNQYVCQPDHIKDLYRIFQEECEKYGIIYRMKDIIKGYKKVKQGNVQLQIFEED